MTFCETCRRAELSPGRRLLEDVRKTLFPPRMSYVQSMARAMSLMIGAATDTPAPTPYERHRELYAQTGDELEYHRMLRHVEST